MIKKLRTNKVDKFTDKGGLVIIVEYELSTEDETKYIQELYYLANGETGFYVSNDLVENNDENLYDFEQYRSLTEAKTSEYFPYFLELDMIKEKTLAETMSILNDLNNYEITVQQVNTGKGTEFYARIKNKRLPAVEAKLELKRKAEDQVVLSANAVEGVGC